MVILRDPSLPDNLTDGEVYCVLNALDNKNRFYADAEDIVKKRLCCHSHEKGFLNKNDKLLLNEEIIQRKNFGILEHLYRKMESLAKVRSSVEPLSSEFIDATKQKHYTEVLLFCASLLIDFHDKSDCSKYISLALKFYFKAYEFVSFTTIAKSSTIKNDLLNYLRYIVSYKCEPGLFIGYVKEFLQIYEFVQPGRSFEDGDYEILRDICKISHDLNFDFLSLLRNGYNGLDMKEFLQRSILENFRRYIILARFGFEDRYYQGAVQEYKEDICATGDLGRRLERYITLDEGNHVFFRSFQVFYLYLCYSGAQVPEMLEETLRLLWNTIPDPFLTKKQFLSCFKKVRGINYPSAVLKAWNWYAHNVLIDENADMCPRSLKHISRCNVRRRFTPCAQLSKNLPTIEVPVTLKSYLCLQY